jgi:autophagy-related protein 16
MNEILQLLVERNALETTPFVSIHESNATLLNQVDSLQNKCKAAKWEISRLRDEIQDATLSPSGTNSNGNAAAAALKNDKRLRDKLEKLQEELNAKLKVESEDRAAALKTTKEHLEMKDLTITQERSIASLKEEDERAKRAIEHLTNGMASAKSDTKLAEQQYEGLKKTIRVLQEESDKLQKENRELETRLVTDKGKVVEEMNKLTDMVDSLKKEVDMLRSYKKQESTLKSWFGGGGGKTPEKIGIVKSTEESENSRKWGNFGIILPSAPKQTVKAHITEGTCVKYDASGNDLVATASNDSTVKIWDANTGAVRATLTGTKGYPMMCCDINGSLAVGAGTDKTCRVWNIRTERMVRGLTRTVFLMFVFAAR